MMREKIEGEPKSCESCGASFGCGANLGSCWCFEVELSADTSADLRTKYKDCLCRKCLAVAAAATEKGPPLFY